MISWLLFVVVTGSLLIPEYLCSRICFSCTDLHDGDACQHVIKCRDGEICYTQKYFSRNNETLYSFGCTYPELCRKDSLGAIFGKRNAEHSHVLCHKCCDTSICNSELECDDNFKASSITCLSCSGVQSPLSCRNTITCGQDEVCYMHKYETNSNNTVYDLGCKHSSACLNKYHISGTGLGKRTDTETHLTCQSCCNEYSLCNQNINCSHTNLKNINDSCVSSSECSSSLVCTLGKCGCPTDDYFWKNGACFIHKNVGQLCDKTVECSYPLQCIDGVCKCSKGQYWNTTHCRPQKTITEQCKFSTECTETLYCVHGVCKCDKIDIWNGHNCSAKRTYHEPCLTDNDCQSSEHCLNEKCECYNLYWDGIKCQGHKPLECADIDFTTDGLFLVYPNDNPAEVNCVIREGLKWTVFQRRVDGSVSFNQNWNEYKQGFGNSSGEFWLGNEIIHLISSNGQHRLRVEMTKEGQNYYADYSQFLVESESNKYRLTVTGYHGNAGDSLNKDGDTYGKANGMMFSTYDRDSNNCAYGDTSGWWHNNCYRGNLNRHPGYWQYNLGNAYNIETSTMMITRTTR